MSAAAYSLLVLVNEEKYQRGKRAFTIYRYLFEDGSIIYSRCLDPRLLATGHAEIISKPQHCWKCKEAKPHLYYKHSDNIHCVVCGSELDEKLDTRPQADILAYPNGKHES